MSDNFDAAAWVDQHSIRTVRAETLSLDGVLIGKHLAPQKFISGAHGGGFSFADIVFGVDMANIPQLGFDFGDWRGELRDIQLRPDPSTLVVDPSLDGLGSVLCDITDQNSVPLPVCSRSTLKRMVEELAARGYTGKAAIEIEATVFEESIEQARAQDFKNLHPLGGSSGAVYVLSRSRDFTEYMDAVARRLDELGIPWEGWADESSIGQIEFNISPTDIVTAADLYVRTRQAMRTVAYELGRTVTFMARWAPDQYGQGSHINLSLERDGVNAFHNPDNPHRPSQAMTDFIGGVLETLPAATTFQFPTINSYKRIVELDGPPTSITWGVENKSTAVRAICRDAKQTRVEYRVTSADVNIYLAFAAFLAGGIIGLDQHIDPGPECDVMAWGLPAGTVPKIPTSLSAATDILVADTLLSKVLGADLVDYWAGTRRWEWLQFHTTGGDPDAGISDWELQRYFEHI
ncbi:glutamine synthetase family protein [Rhodococcus sp. NPDC059968]|uniref:glutamine synthetase family protein n=1 Tax=Rhodococcus sp. NPDC059968 TaxID=3347017 RepID=UPI00366EB3DE